MTIDAANAEVVHSLVGDAAGVGEAGEEEHAAIPPLSTWEVVEAVLVKYA